MANLTVHNTENAAQEAWEAFLRTHPRVHGFLSILSSFFGYFVNGHAIVAFVQWMVRVAGRVAESALLLATLYVTLNNVAHTLVSWILPATALSALNYLSLVAFSLLPELIVAAAIKITVDHWTLLVRNFSWRNIAWVWAVLYSLPTVTFVIMTVYTLLGFVQVVAVSGAPTQATGTSLTIRFLAGWSYAMVEILFATIGKKSYTATLDGLRAMVTTQGQELSILKAMEQELRATVDRLTSERDSHANRATVATQELRIARESIARLQEEKATAQQALEDATQEVERLQGRVHRAKTRADRRAIAPVPSTSVAMTEGHSQATSYEQKATQESQPTGYVAIDDGHTIAITNETGATLMATGSHRDRIKEAMLRAIQTGSGINLKAIAEATGTGYSTVKKWKQAILEEIAREQTREIAVVADPEQPEHPS